MCDLNILKSTFYLYIGTCVCVCVCMCVCVCKHMILLTSLLRWQNLHLLPLVRVLSYRNKSTLFPKREKKTFAKYVYILTGKMNNIFNYLFKPWHRWSYLILSRAGSEEIELAEGRMGWEVGGAVLEFNQRKAVKEEVS